MARIPDSTPVSPWVARWADLVLDGPVLDVASGPGRNARLFASLGFDVVAIDRDPYVIEGVEFVQADLESGAPWPLGDRVFGGIVVTNYLHRPLFEILRRSLSPGGVLIYETFMVGHERYRKPSNPDFLLCPGELLEAFKDLEILGFEEGEFDTPKPAVLQRLCARAPR